MDRKWREILSRSSAAEIRREIERRRLAPSRYSNARYFGKRIAFSPSLSTPKKSNFGVIRIPPNSVVVNWSVA